MEKVEILEEQIRKKDELLELVAVLTAKNIALEEDLEAIKEAYHGNLKELWQKQMEIQRLEDMENQQDEDEMDQAYDEEHQSDGRYNKIMPESLQKGIDEYDYEAACLQAEIEEARETEEIEQDEDEDVSMKDWTPPSYEDVVDPEFDRGFNMAYDKAIGDVMNYLQGLRDSDDKWSI